MNCFYKFCIGPQTLITLQIPGPFHSKSFLLDLSARIPISGPHDHIGKKGRLSESKAWAGTSLRTWPRIARMMSHGYLKIHVNWGHEFFTETCSSPQWVIFSSLYGISILSITQTRSLGVIPRDFCSHHSPTMLQPSWTALTFSGMPYILWLLES